MVAQQGVHYTMIQHHHSHLVFPGILECHLKPCNLVWVWTRTNYCIVKWQMPLNIYIYTHTQYSYQTPFPIQIPTMIDETIGNWLSINKMAGNKKPTYKWCRGKLRNSPITSMTWEYQTVSLSMNFLLSLSSIYCKILKCYTVNYRMWNKELNKLASGGFRKKLK